MQRVLPLSITALVACYQAATVTPCNVSCAADGVCPTGLTCGADQLCHGGTIECSEQVNGTFGHQVITGDPTTGSGIETDLEYEADQLDVSAVLTDTGGVPMVTFAGDQFGFARSMVDEPYRLSVRAQQETTVPTEVQDTVPTVELWTPYFGRVTRVAINKTTNITVSMSGATATTKAYIASTGIRTFTLVPIATPMTNLSFTFNYENASSLYGAAGALQAAAGDVLYYLGFTQTNPDAMSVDDYFAVTSQYHEMVTMTNGGTITIGTAIAPQPLTPMPPDHCVMLGLPRATQLARLEASNPFGSAATNPAGGMVTGVVNAWGINAVPMAAFSPTAGIPLVYMVSPNNTGPPDVTVPINFANPFPEDEQIGFATTQFRRSAALTGAGAVTLVYQTIEYLQIPTAPAASCASVTLSSGLALPGSPALAGTTLDTDNQVVTFDRSNLLDLTFPPSTDGSADDYQVNLYEATNSGGTTAFTELRIYSTLTPDVLIDPKLLVMGHSYVFIVESRLGYPLAPMRDYRTISYPFASSQIYTSIFQVGS